MYSAAAVLEPSVSLRVVQPGLGGSLEALAHAVRGNESLGVGDELVLDSLVANREAKAVLGVVLEQGVGPRRAVAVTC